MKSFKIILLILFVGFGLGSCQDFLNPTKDNQFTKDRFNTDPAWAQGLLINAYTSLPTSYELSDVATDDAVTNDLTGNAYWPFLRLATGEWSSLFDPLGPTPSSGILTTGVWTSSYGALVNINYFLSIVNQVQWSWQDTIRNRIFRQRYIGESFAFKGYYYLRLLQRYGGVASDGVLRGVPIASGIITTSDNYQLIRPTFQATVDSINSFLESGRKLLPYRYFDYNPADTPFKLSWNRVNGAGINQNLIDGRVALALRARLALLAGSPAFNNGNYDLVKCDSAAQISGRMIKNNGGLAAFPSDANFWNADGDVSNAEILWRNDYESSGSRNRESDNYPPSVFGNGRINPTQNLVNAFPMANGYPITDPNSGYNPNKPYVGRDSRLKMNILTDSTSLRGTIIRTESDALTNDGLNKLSLYSTRTGYYLLKLLRTDVNLNPSGPTSQRHFYTHIRWTEMFLIYAEATNEKYGPDGDAGYGMTPRQVIAAIRKRAGITQPDLYLATITTASAMRDMIRNERRLETCFESQRFWDMRRWALPASVINANAMGINITGTPANYGGATSFVVEPRIYTLPQMYYGPIPYLDTKKYPGMLQNNGW